VWTIGAGSQKAEVRRRDLKDKTQEVVEFARSRLGFFPDPQQEELLRSGEKSGRQVIDLPHSHRRIVNCTRQWGKSTVAAVVAVHRAYFRAKSLVVVACPTEKQSAELVWKARDFMTKLGLRQRRDGSNRISLRFPNGSRIVGIPGKEATLRGFSAVSLLIIDEASRVDDAVYKALRPMLAVGNGDLWLLSTPFGKRGFFYENWAGGGEDWVRTAVPATECSRITDGFLEQERRQMGDLWFRQEYLCEFIDEGHQMFGRDLVMAALDEDEPMRF
jgi:hypothetical protein